ncbi:hypothetical protein BHM03_00000058 [Ensete ventricosum]|uniref:Uncharacterized protein n=1 Tax=Ensete ventricosum TaxID=4639 RepID=A0A445M874_ENSVE|nr:hypothetical protein BHM03_00000058 [Ensete ventricosum]
MRCGHLSLLKLRLAIHLSLSLALSTSPDSIRFRTAEEGRRRRRRRRRTKGELLRRDLFFLAFSLLVQSKISALVDSLSLSLEKRANFIGFIVSSLESVTRSKKLLYGSVSPVPVIELLDIVPNETYIFLLGSKAEKNGDVQRRKSCSDKDSSVLRRRDSSGRYSPVICKALTKGFRLFIFFSYEIVGGWLAEGGDNLEPTGASPPIDNLR